MTLVEFDLVSEIIEYGFQPAAIIAFISAIVATGKYIYMNLHEKGRTHELSSSLS